VKVYHGSCIEVHNPKISYSRANVDFGKGFYVTQIYEQAVKWSLRFKKKDKAAIVSCYDLDANAFKGYSVKEFSGYTEEWLDFIVDCRSLKDESNYDVVIGGVADDRVFNTVELYLDGLVDKIEAIKRLKYEKPNMQICIRNQEIIDKYMKFEGSEKL